MNNYDNKNQQGSLKVQEMTFERLRNVTKASGLNIFFRFVVLFLVIVGVFELYRYNTRIPDGVTNEDKIMTEMADAIDNSFGLDIEFNSEQISYDVNEKRIFIYKNTQTNRFVFPIKDQNTGKTHYCYLASYEDTNGYTTKLVTDIYHHNWTRIINKRVASIEDDNTPEKRYAYTIAQYYLYYSGIEKAWLTEELE